MLVRVLGPLSNHDARDVRLVNCDEQGRGCAEHLHRALDVLKQGACFDISMGTRSRLVKDKTPNCSINIT